MKKIILILDGMADRGQKVLGGKTPLEYADTPNLDKLFQKSKGGCVQTIPEGEEAGSAVANLNMLGYTSSEVYRGRAVIEAAGADIDIDKKSLYIRTNFVSFIGDSFDESVIESYSAHEIKTEDAESLVKKLNSELFEEGLELINTDSFRNILVVKNKAREYEALNFVPPHDILGQPIKDYMTGNEIYESYFGLLKKAYDILSKDNKTKTNGIWFWGASVAPNIKRTKTKEKKVILSETTLMRGIAKMMKIKCVSLAVGGGFEAFLKAKLKAALSVLDTDSDFIYLHIQEPDDLSHELMPKEKAKALEMIDKIFVKGLLDKLDTMEENFSLVVASDHYTFSDTGSHGRQPAPFMLYKKGAQMMGNEQFTEKTCIAQKYVLPPKELLGNM